MVRLLSRLYGWLCAVLSALCCCCCPRRPSKPTSPYDDMEEGQASVWGRCWRGSQRAKNRSTGPHVALVMRFTVQQADLERCLHGIRRWRKDIVLSRADIEEEKILARRLQEAFADQLKTVSRLEPVVFHKTRGKLELWCMVEIRLEEVGARLSFLWDAALDLASLEDKIRKERPPLRQAMLAKYRIIEKVLLGLQSQGLALQPPHFGKVDDNEGFDPPPSWRQPTRTPVRRLVRKLIEQTKMCSSPPPPVTPKASEDSSRRAALTPPAASPPAESADSLAAARALYFGEHGSKQAFGSTEETDAAAPMEDVALLAAGSMASSSGREVQHTQRLSEQPQSSPQSGDASSSAEEASALLLGRSSLEKSEAEGGQAGGSGPEAAAAAGVPPGSAVPYLDGGSQGSSDIGRGESPGGSKQLGRSLESSQAGTMGLGGSSSGQWGSNVGSTGAEREESPGSSSGHLGSSLEGSGAGSGDPASSSSWHEDHMPDMEYAQGAGGQATPALSRTHAPSWANLPRTIFRSSGIRPTPEDTIKRLPRVLALYHELRNGASAEIINWSSSAPAKAAGETAVRGPQLRSTGVQDPGETSGPEAAAALAQLEQDVQGFQAASMLEASSFVQARLSSLQSAGISEEGLEVAMVSCPRWKTVVDAAKVYERLVEIKAALADWAPTVQVDTLAESQRLCSFLDDAFGETTKVAHHTSELRVRMKEHSVPWDPALLDEVRWAAQSASIALINHCFEEARALARQRRQGSSHALLHPLANAAVGVLRVHQFAGGLNNAATAAFDALCTSTLHHARAIDPKWWRSHKMVKS